MWTQAFPFSNLGPHTHAAPVVLYNLPYPSLGSNPVRSDESDGGIAAIGPSASSLRSSNKVTMSIEHLHPSPHGAVTVPIPSAQDKRFVHGARHAVLCSRSTGPARVGGFTSERSSRRGVPHRLVQSGRSVACTVPTIPLFIYLFFLSFLFFRRERTPTVRCLGLRTPMQARLKNCCLLFFPPPYCSIRTYIHS